MKLLNIFKNFAKDESGAVTVDFVVLTAGIVGLGILIVSAVTPQVELTAAQIATDMQNAREIGR
ncbi:MAG: pilus assembly protein [Gemmobacter sp.]|uniref:Flp family type IVb pilin n=1 Tax=Gemmobacter sp. TaxID=1898957 RepID=UPI001A5BF74F|nr:pilus assembly protein [Gemmobacter sp.]MBL8562414.1 pilus assembly protein [Gemmobacter sp.]